MAIDELCIALQMEDCKMEVDKEENSKAVDKPKTTTLGKSVKIPHTVFSLMISSLKQFSHPSKGTIQVFIAQEEKLMLKIYEFSRFYNFKE